MKPSLWCDDGIEAATRAAQDREIALTKQLIERYRREEAQLYWGEGYADWKKALLFPNRG
ncbi:MAG: hypothetical protein WKH97_10450 [Casimicrobiaceae bacterium]